MLPPLKIIRRGLYRTTEQLAHALARPGMEAPDWTTLEWQLAHAAAAAHGVAPLLQRFSMWQHSDWRRFLVEQRAHVELRHQRISGLLQQIDRRAQACGIAMVALKGAALHAMGLYAPGERPMADIDLLIHPDDLEAASGLLCALGYELSFTQWKHRVFKPRHAAAPTGLGEHCDTPVNIELHTRIQEKLPVSIVDITDAIYPRQPHPGLNPYPSTTALMAHLLLHAAGNICGRSMRLIHVHDISLLATRMLPAEWDALWSLPSNLAPWWAWPPLSLVARYYRGAIPAAVMARAAAQCAAPLRLASRRQTLSRVSCSELWLHAFDGLEWSRSAGDLWGYVRNRIRPTRESAEERAAMVRSQLWLQDQDWVTASHARRVWAWLTRPVPRMDTLYVVKAALQPAAA